MRIVETDNFGRDFPDEKFLDLPSLREADAKLLADCINSCFPHDHPRYWRVVPDDYKLQPGFEP